jgi:hypothetical protein
MQNAVPDEAIQIHATLHATLHYIYILQNLRGETIEGGKEEVTQAVGDEREEESLK